MITPRKCEHNVNIKSPCCFLFPLTQSSLAARCLNIYAHTNEGKKKRRDDNRLKREDSSAAVAASQPASDNNSNDPPIFSPTIEKEMDNHPTKSFNQ
ncbi:unnamed protein product [Caenorhabditis angaria]|uniref:Uncharacterized protein n=1 Tax=Caenorhabditis angaria TaxID=860376 RepID=A0A9P1I2H9_9PELO|nr:unnamed protein product [Caenorhabditis angaria]